VVTRTSNRSRAAAVEIAILAFFLAGAICFTYPLVTGLDRLVTDHADPFVSAWTISWDVHQLLRDPLHLFDANIFHPETGTLGFSESFLGIAILMAPVELLFRSPVLTHNVALIFLVALSGYTAYLLSVQVTGSRLAGFVAGSFFAFTPYRLGHLSHLALQASGFIPLAFLSVSRYCESPRLLRLGAVALSLWWVTAACGYYGVFTWIALGVLIPWELLRNSGARLLRDTLALGSALALTALCLWPLARPYLRIQREFGFARPVERLVPASARVHSYARSNGSWYQSLGLRDANAEQALFPGVALSLLACLGLFALDRRTALYAVLGSLAFWASLGPGAGLYRLLHALIPGVSGLRVPARFSILVFLALSILAGAAVMALEKRARPRGRAFLLLLALLPLAETWSTPKGFVEAPVEAPLSEPFLASATPRNAAVVHLPMPHDRERIRENAVYMLWSTLHFRPMVNGYSTFTPPSFYEAARALESFPDEASLALLRNRGVEYVVFHKDRYLRERARELMEKITADRRVEVVLEDDEVAVFRLRATG
jgi:hypothetical protein